MILKNIKDFIQEAVPNSFSDLTDDLGLVSSLNNKVDKVTGKGLSSNDFSNTYKAQLDGLDADLAELEDMIGDAITYINQ